MAQTVENLPAMQEMRVQSLGQQDPLERKWKPTPIFLPGKSHGQRSLVEPPYNPGGAMKELDRTKPLNNNKHRRLRKYNIKKRP